MLDNRADKDPVAGEQDVWKRLDRETRPFRYVQEPIFNLSEAEVEFLEELREGGLDFDLLPRPDPTSHVALRVRLEQATQRVELEVDSTVPSTCSFLTRRTPFAEALKGWLDRILGGERFDARRYVASRRYVWYPYVLPPRAPSLRASGRDSRLGRSLFNFDAKERHFLGLLEKAVEEAPQGPCLRLEVYPRDTLYGGLELMACQGERHQPTRVFVKGFYPITYHVITENTPLGNLLKGRLDRALGAEHLDVESSRLKGRYLWLVYSVRHPSAILEQFES